MMKNNMAENLRKSWGKSVIATPKFGRMAAIDAETALLNEEERYNFPNIEHDAVLGTLMGAGYDQGTAESMIVCW